MIAYRWYVQLAAIWYWYLPLYIYVIHFFFYVSVHCFCIFFFNPALTNQMEWSTIPASLKLINLINRGNIEGTLHKIMFVCFMFV